MNNQREVIDERRKYNNRSKTDDRINGNKKKKELDMQIKIDLKNGMKLRCYRKTTIILGSRRQYHNQLKRKEEITQTVYRKTLFR